MTFDGFDPLFDPQPLTVLILRQQVAKALKVDPSDVTITTAVESLDLHLAVKKSGRVLRATVSHGMYPEEIIEAFRAAVDDISIATRPAAAYVKA